MKIRRYLVLSASALLGLASCQGEQPSSSFAPASSSSTESFIDVYSSDSSSEDSVYYLSYVTGNDKSFNVIGLFEGSYINSFLPPLTKTGYTFGGWYLDSRYERPVSTSDKMPANDITVYAKWIPNKVRVIYNGNRATSGEMTPSDHIFDEDGAFALKSNAFTREGYDFVGWNASSDGSGATYAYLSQDDFAKSENELTLYAIWSVHSHLLSFMPNALLPVNSVKLDYGTKLISYLPTLTKEGYELEGWYLDRELTQKVDEHTSVPDADITLYAKWSPINVNLAIRLEVEKPELLGTYLEYGEPYVYTDYKTEETVDIKSLVEEIISNDDNLAHHENVASSNLSSIKMLPRGNTVAIVLDLVRHDVSFKKEGVEVYKTTVAYGTKIPSNLSFEGDIYQKGYTPKFELGETTYTEYSDIVVTGDSEINVTYSVNTNALSAVAAGGDFPDGSKTLTYESFAYGTPFSSLPKPSREGYDFAGWYFDVSYTKEAVAMDDGEHDVVYAKWEPHTLDVTYHPNGGVFEMEDSHHSYDSEHVAFPSENGFLRMGYSFGGWVDSNNQPVNALGVEYFTSSSNTLDLYAKWIPHTLDVDYDGNGSDGGMIEPMPVICGEPGYETLAPNVYTRTGYTYVAWMNEESEVVESLAPADFVEENGSLSLKAKWEPNRCLVHYEGNGGTGTMADSVHEYDQEGFRNLSANTFVRPGYTFLGWNDKADGSGNDYTALTDGNFAKAENELTLYAQWKANALKVVYNGNGSTKGSMDPVTLTYGQNGWNTISENTYGKTSCRFTAWNDKEDGSGNTYTELTVSDYSAEDGTLTLYAQWEPIPYEENDDTTEGVDLSDLSALYGAFAGLSNYSSHTISYFNYAGAYDYYRHYAVNPIQEKTELFTADSYYVYPELDAYLDYLNLGYYNKDGSYYSYALEGDDVASRLDSNLTNDDLSLEGSGSYQDHTFTLADLTESYLTSASFTRVSEKKYVSENRTKAFDFLSICAPTMINTGYYMTFSKVSIEIAPNDDYAFRIRLYASPTQIGKLDADHKDEDKPNWYLLFAEAYVYDVGETVIPPVESL